MDCGEGGGGGLWLSCEMEQSGVLFSTASLSGATGIGAALGEGDGGCWSVSVAEKFSINFCGKCCSTDVCRSAVVWLNCATIICHQLLLLL